MRRSSQGFSLLEVLVAFVILALSLGVLMRVFSGGINNIAVSERYTHAVLLAESKLAAVGSEFPLVEGETSGESTDSATGESTRTYHWHLRISPEIAEARGPERVNLPLELFRVEVTVTWQQDTPQPRRVRLSTLRAGMGT